MNNISIFTLCHATVAYSLYRMFKLCYDACCTNDIVIKSQVTLKYRELVVLLLVIIACDCRFCGE